MPPKPKDGDKPVLKPKDIGEDIIKDLKKFIEVYTKSCTSSGVEASNAVLRRFREEIRSWQEGDVKELLPIFPVIVQEVLSFEGLRSLLEGLNVYKWLHQISFWRAGLGNDGTILLSEFLRTDRKLKTLELIGCDIGPQGGSYLGRALAVNGTLLHLIMEHNRTFGDEGLLLMGDGLKWNSTLQVLNLAYCNIGDPGGEAVAKFVIRSSGVQTLVLRGNNIGPAGLTEIAHSLAKNLSLTSLDLADNQFGIDLQAVESLRDALEANDKLTSLDLHLNSLIPRATESLLEVVKLKQNLLDLKLYERCQEEVFTDLLGTLDVNKKADAKAKKKGGKKSKTTD
eukprot:NODE_2028_length_1221_cov_38.075085_g1684_i0.p1 GENE.NODE_2028_length_1221_cov_38.075085_g1684_i0~~NODE_2028_length_1221_cov_38.075085_g1684_i0.p1  ORF type:complete len:340 (+),score=103.02 NODE_2028_length_1221_cov_38.075085_g1684_i0:115-1134(+)